MVINLSSAWSYKPSFTLSASNIGVLSVSKMGSPSTNNNSLFFLTGFLVIDLIVNDTEFLSD
mgnify:FL=1